MRATKTIAAVAAGAALAAFAAAPAVAQGDMGTPAATASLKSSDGKDVGTVDVFETPHGLLVQLDAMGLPQGGHGFHIHTTGKCDAPDFKSAGGHFNPADAKHGILSEGGPHAGDMPNIFVGDDGKARVDVFVADVSVSGGDNALLDDDGAAFMIHSGTDDYKSDPAGDAGNRIACGVVEKASGGSQ